MSLVKDGRFPLDEALPELIFSNCRLWATGYVKSAFASCDVLLEHIWRNIVLGFSLP